MGQESWPDGAGSKEFASAVEDAFIGERGTPFLLMSKDWRRIEQWYRDGIPFETIVRAIHQVFEKRRAREETRKISSIEYCANAVEELWAFERRGLVGKTFPGSELPQTPMTQKLLVLRENLAARVSECPEGIELADWKKALDKAVEKITALDPAAGFEELEKSLSSIESSLLKSIEKLMKEERMAVLMQRVEEALGDASTVRASVAEKLRRALKNRELRRSSGLPPLTLFDV